MHATAELNEKSSFALGRTEITAEPDPKFPNTQIRSRSRSDSCGPGSYAPAH